MVKPRALSTALAAIAISSTARNGAHAFQHSRPAAPLPPAAARNNAPFATTPSSIGAPSYTSSNNRRGAVVVANANANANTAPADRSGEQQPSRSSRAISLFGTNNPSLRTRAAIRKLRRSFAVLVASFAFLLSSTRVHSPPAHAASATATTTTASSSSSRGWKSVVVNPFRTRTADEMIDSYVRDRLFADDEFDPVESAYREAYSDYAPPARQGEKGDETSSSSSSSSSATSTGAYPTLLAETATSALGRQKSVSSVLSSSTSQGVGTSSSSGRNDGITAVLIKASDLMQSKLKVSASVSYYIIAGVSIFGICTVPGMIGVLYQGIQRLQIDKSEMKMYGKISDMDATSKKVSDDDDDDDEEE